MSKVFLDDSIEFLNEKAVYQYLMINSANLIQCNPFDSAALEPIEVLEMLEEKHIAALYSSKAVVFYVGLNMLVNDMKQEKIPITAESLAAQVIKVSRDNSEYQSYKNGFRERLKASLNINVMNFENDLEFQKEFRHQDFIKSYVALLDKNKYKNAKSNSYDYFIQMLEFEKKIRPETTEVLLISNVQIEKNLQFNSKMATYTQL